MATRAPSQALMLLLVTAFILLFLFLGLSAIELAILGRYIGLSFLTMLLLGFIVMLLVLHRASRFRKGHYYRCNYTRKK